MANTLLYLTDNSLEPSIAEPCKAILLREAQGLPIVSVSQKPLDFGYNVCVGEIGRSWTSIYRQILAGLEAVNTEWLCMIEHDVLYTSEHLHYQPTDPDVFWYNANHWLVQWHGHHPGIRRDVLVPPAPFCLFADDLPGGHAAPLYPGDFGSD